MGKRAKNNKKRQLKKQLKHEKPFVSVCTPTFNRRPFIPSIIKCYMEQDYPQDKMEWIIIDDGTDSIEDLVSDISGVKYFRYEEKLTLGKKRNLMHEKSKGDIIVYMDDDDYYPPQRVSHAVTTLLRSSKALCAGSSEMHIWFNDTQQMIQFGPYGPNHATAGTFAFKRKLLDITSYEETACLAEEKHFLKNYTIPFVQLNPRQTILCFSHEHNTFDKRRLLNGMENNKFVNASTYEVGDFIKDDNLKRFYTEEIKEILKDYEPGKPEHKPDVIQQTKEITEKRKKMLEKENENAPIVVKSSDGSQQQLTNSQVLELLQKQQTQLKQSLDVIQALKQRLSAQDETIESLQQQITEFVREKEAAECEKETENVTLTLTEKITFDNSSNQCDISSNKAICSLKDFIAKEE